MQLPSFVTQFMDTFAKHGYKIYAVGGTVRGLLMKHEVNDWDFTTSARPEQIQKLFEHHFYNNQFGTVGVPIDVNGNELVFEVTTFRKEGKYSNARHPDEVQWAETIEEDLSRRDFTINALAFDGKELIDPFGGQDDIEKRVVRAVGKPDERFGEDALRLLRAVRQATQLGFMIEEKTHASIVANAQNISRISGERIREELFKILASPHAADGILLLKNTGLLHHILPEVDNAFGVEQKSPHRHHVFDVGTHLVESLRHCPSSEVITRFSTLIHDIGKVQTHRKDPKTHIITFYNHEVVGEKQAEKIADRLRLSKDQKQKLVTLVRHHQFSVSEKQSDKAIRRFVKNVGKEWIQDMLDLRTGDRLGSGAKETSWRTELFKKRLVEVQKKPFTVHDLTITGHDVMEELSMKPGPQIGTILEQLFEEVVEGRVKNEKKALLEQMKMISS